MFNFFYFRHHLRDPKKNANPGDQEQDTPDELKRVFFMRHRTPLNKFMWLSGNLQVNTSDRYLTTKNTKAG